MFKGIPNLPPNYALRHAQAMDAEFRFHLFRSTRPELAALPLPEGGEANLLRIQYQAQQADYAANYPNLNTHLILCDNNPAGLVGTADKSGAFYLVDIALMPEHRNKGIGTALLRSLQSEAIRTNRPVRLTVSWDNPLAERLYKRLGFNVLRTTPLHLQLVRHPRANNDSASSPARMSEV